MTVVAAIPTLEALTTLKPLVRTLLNDSALDKLLLMDNGHGPEGRDWMRRQEKFDARVVVVSLPDIGIYEMWNYAWDWARALDPDAYLMVLNDDVAICDGTVTELADSLDILDRMWLVSPNRERRVADGILPLEIEVQDSVIPMPPRSNRLIRNVHGTFRHGGIAGCCWMLRTNCRDQGVPPIDEQFEWWAGDDDLAFSVEAAGGRLGVAEWIPLDHSPETTARNHEWTFAARERDRLRWIEKWGHVDPGW